MYWDVSGTATSRDTPDKWGLVLSTVLYVYYTFYNNYDISAQKNFRDIVPLIS